MISFNEYKWKSKIEHSEYISIKMKLGISRDNTFWNKIF